MTNIIAKAVVLAKFKRKTKGLIVKRKSANQNAPLTFWERSKKNIAKIAKVAKITVATFKPISGGQI